MLFSRLLSPIFLVGAGPDQNQYAVHEDILKQSKVLGRMCEGDFKEAHERRITLPDDDPIDVGILVEYLYTNNFWSNGNPNPDVSNQDSALHLARLYILADKYDLEGMKAVVVTKIHKHTDIKAPQDWLTVAEIIYAAIPDTDTKFPRYVRSLLVRLMRVHIRSEGDGISKVLEQWTAKGGRLAVDISRATRKYWVWRVTGRKEALDRAWSSMISKKGLHDYNHEDCEDNCFDEYWELPDESLGTRNLDVVNSFDEDIIESG